MLNGLTWKGSREARFMQATPNNPSTELGNHLSIYYPIDIHWITIRQPEFTDFPGTQKRRQPHSLSLCDRTQWKRHARNPRSSCWRRPVIPECVECRAPRIGYPEKFSLPPQKPVPEGIASKNEQSFHIFSIWQGFLHLFGTWPCVFLCVPFYLKTHQPSASDSCLMRRKKMICFNGKTSIDFFSS